MVKSSSVAEAPPESQPQPRSAKPRKRRAAAAAPSTALAPAPTASVAPLLIGLGVGAALGAAVLVIGSQARSGRSRVRGQPSLAGSIAKAAMLALARAVAQKAVRMAADRAALTVGDAWNPLKLR